MAKPEIRKLTNEELKAINSMSEREKQSSFSDNAKKANLRSDLYSNEYIKALKLSEVSEFFKPFGLLACAKIPKTPNKIRGTEVEDPAFIFVSCEDFNATFSDYNTVLDFGERLFSADESENKFDMDAFKKYCDTLNISPENAIREMMVVDLFGKRFPSYGENYRAVKQKEAELAKEKLPKSMRKSIAPVSEKAELMVDSTANKLKYGTYDALKNYFGE